MLPDDGRDTSTCVEWSITTGTGTVFSESSSELERLMEYGDEEMKESTGAACEV